MLFPVFPILLILMAIASFVWYQHTDNDMFWVLAASSAVIGLVWGLIMMPWTVQLLALLIVMGLRPPLLRTRKINIK
jgi:uncharacterized membrane protein